MRKNHLHLLIILPFLFSSKLCLSQEDILVKEQKLFEEQWLKKYRNLRGNLDDQFNLKSMTVLPFYKFDPSFRVTAKLDTALSNYFELQTTQHRPVWYRIYGYLTFTLAGKQFYMPIYQSKNSVLKGEKDLFFPFTDLTNGNGTYEGGRYIEMPMPEGNTITLDFNKSFNPFCVYSHVYSCELVPKENHFDIEINAGIKIK